jgi:bifunctional ADP-heptose synthase (sugar kinase/adenylyltransferase)
VLLKELQPEIWMKGGDYTERDIPEVERGAVKSYGGQLHIAPKFDGVSTYRFIQDLKGSNNRRSGE